MQWPFTQYQDHLPCSEEGEEGEEEDEEDEDEEDWRAMWFSPGDIPAPASRLKEILEIWIVPFSCLSLLFDVVDGEEDGEGWGDDNIDSGVVGADAAIGEDAGEGGVDVDVGDVVPIGIKLRQA